MSKKFSTRYFQGQLSSVWLGSLHSGTTVQTRKLPCNFQQCSLGVLIPLTLNKPICLRLRGSSDCAEHSGGAQLREAQNLHHILDIRHRAAVPPRYTVARWRAALHYGIWFKITADLCPWSCPEYGHTSSPPALTLLLCSCPPQCARPQIFDLQLYLGLVQSPLTTEDGNGFLETSVP